MLARSHAKLMKAIQKNKVIRISKPNKDLDYLYDQKYIEITECDKPDDYYAQPYLTEKGKARLEIEYQNKFRFWTPIIISNLFAVGALIVSIVSLLK